MTNERLEEIAARVDAATPGPWFAAASSVHSAPLSREYDRVERDIPEDAPAEAYAALPNSCVATVPVVSGDTPTARGVADAAFIAHAREDIPALIAELAAERETVARLREEVALLNAHINKRNADDFHALAEHQHEVNTLRARIEAGIAAAWCMFCDGDGYAVTYDPKNPDEPCHVCQGSAKDNRVVKALRGEG